MKERREREGKREKGKKEGKRNKYPSSGGWGVCKIKMPADLFPGLANSCLPGLQIAASPSLFTWSFLKVCMWRSLSLSLFLFL